MSPETIRFDTDELLDAVAATTGPAVCAADIASDCDDDHDRDVIAFNLADLECDGLLTSKCINGVETWRLTDAGREHLDG